MTENERVRELRKALDLTLEKFGKQLGVTKVAISNIENGNRKLTEQMKKLICREFNVDYIWLTTGEGEMFVDTDDDIMEMIDRIMAGEDEFYKKILKTLSRLDESELRALESFIDKFHETKKG